jgi:prepilin-type N-terminal cleavage/methylation domain-containing protein
MKNSVLATDTWRSGLTLLELMVVLVILGALAAIAIPMLVHSKILSHETSAAQTLRMLAAAQTEYLRDNNNCYAIWDELVQGNYLSDAELRQRKQKAGYMFQIQVSAADGNWYQDPTPALDDPGARRMWYAQAVPDDYGVSGKRSFYVDESNTIRYKDTGHNNFVPRTEAQNWQLWAD